MHYTEDMSVRDLPMEVWSRVATFLPFESLLPTFWSLRDARILPDTHTNASNAFLQFCTGVMEVQEETEEEDRVYDLSDEMRATLDRMGFDHDLVERATRLCRGRDDAVLDYLLRCL